MFFSNKKPKQDVCLLLETNEVEDQRLDAETLHAENPETAEGWLLDSSQMCRDERTGRYIQFVSSRYGSPIKIYRNRNGRKDQVKIDEISSQTEDQEMVFIDEKQNKDGRLLWIGIITALLTLTVCIIAAAIVI